VPHLIGAGALLADRHVGGPPVAGPGVSLFEQPTNHVNGGDGAAEFYET
jgi:hypothetical protein